MTDVSKNVHFDVLDNIVNKYNNTVHRTMKMRPINVTFDSYVVCNEDYNVTKLNLKLLIMLGFQNTETFALKDTLKIGQKKFFLLVKLRIQFCGHT